VSRHVERRDWLPELKVEPGAKNRRVSTHTGEAAHMQTYAPVRQEEVVGLFPTGEGGQAAH